MCWCAVDACARAWCSYCLLSVPCCTALCFGTFVCVWCPEFPNKPLTQQLPSCTPTRPNHLNPVFQSLSFAAGLVAQQQCVGPLQLPISDVAVFAQSHQDITGIATSIGEQPIKGLLDPAAMARLAMGEALTNLCWAAATQLSDIKASVNWMYAAKMKSEGAAMYEAAIALRWVGECGKG